jgi:hypothetical protein
MKKLLLLLLLAAGAHGETCQSFVRRSTEFRLGFLEGLTGGYTAGYLDGHLYAEDQHDALQAVQALMGKDKSPSLPKAEMSRAVPYNHLSGESLLQGIDEICKAPENALVGAENAATIFFMKLKGRDPADIEKSLSVARKMGAH